MQTIEDLTVERNAAPLIRGRVFHPRKRGPGRNRKDSPHRTGGRLTLRARLSKRIRRRACRARRPPAHVREYELSEVVAPRVAAGLIDAVTTSRWSGVSPVVRRR